MKADAHNTNIRSLLITFSRDEYASTLETAEMTLWDLRDLVLATDADARWLYTGITRAATQITVIR